MSPRVQVKSLQVLALRKITLFVRNVVEQVSHQIVANSAFITFEAREYRRGALDEYVSWLREHILEMTIPSQMDQVVNHILIGVKAAADAKRLSWRPGRFFTCIARCR
jgi:hypothetical protein